MCARIESLDVLEKNRGQDGRRGRSYYSNRRRLRSCHGRRRGRSGTNQDRKGNWKASTSPPAPLRWLLRLMETVAGASRGRESIVGPESRDRPARSRRGEAHETSRRAATCTSVQRRERKKVPARWEERQGGDPALGGCFAWQTCTLASMMEVGGGTEDGDVGYRSDWTG